MSDYTQSLLIGPAATLTQNIVYALPARQINIMSTRVLQISVDGSSYADVAATTTGTAVTGVFTKCTTGSAVVVCRV